MFDKKQSRFYCNINTFQARNLRSRTRAEDTGVGHTRSQRSDFLLQEQGERGGPTDRRNNPTEGKDQCNGERAEGHRWDQRAGRPDPQRGEQRRVAGYICRNVEKVSIRSH